MYQRINAARLGPPNDLDEVYLAAEHPIVD